MTAAFEIPVDEKERLRKKSNRAALVSLVGALILLGAIVVSALSLSRLEAEAKDRRAELASLEAVTEKQRDRAQQARAEAERVQKELEEGRLELAALEKEKQSLTYQWEVASRTLGEQRTLTREIGENQRRELPLSLLVEPRTEAVPLSENRFEFRLWLEVPEERRSALEKVTYVFNHPTFPEPEQTSTDAARGFPVSYVGWGALSRVIIRLHEKGGKTEEIAFNMHEAINKTSRVPVREKGMPPAEFKVPEYVPKK